MGGGKIVNLMMLLAATAWLARDPDWEPQIVAIGLFATLIGLELRSKFRSPTTETERSVDSEDLTRTLGDTRDQLARAQKRIQALESEHDSRRELSDRVVALLATDARSLDAILDGLFMDAADVDHRETLLTILGQLIQQGTVAANKDHYYLQP